MLNYKCLVRLACCDRIEMIYFRFRITKKGSKNSYIVNPSGFPGLEPPNCLCHLTSKASLTSPDISLRLRMNRLVYGLFITTIVCPL